MWLQHVRHHHLFFLFQWVLNLFTYLRDIRVNIEADTKVHRWQFNPQIRKEISATCYIAAAHFTFQLASGDLSLVFKQKYCLLSSWLSDFIQSIQVLTKCIQWLCSCSDSKESEWADKAQVYCQYNYRFLMIVPSMLTQLSKLQPAVFGFEGESLWCCESYLKER